MKKNVQMQQEDGNMEQHRLTDATIVYYISGREKKEWVLLIHAAFVNHQMFRSQIDHFRDSYNILTLDIIGHGQSTDTQKGDSITKMSEWINRILMTEQIRKVHIVGISLGAVLAQDFAGHYPEMAGSLACFGGYDIHHFDPNLQKKNGAAQMLMMLKAFVSVRWFAESNKKISAYTLQAQNDFYEMNLQFPKKSFMYLASLSSLINACPPKPRTYPLLIGCGKHDIPMELSAVAQWKKSEPECDVIILDNAGHCVNMDAPGEFNAALEEFWKKTQHT